MGGWVGEKTDDETFDKTQTPTHPPTHYIPHTTRTASFSSIFLQPPTHPPTTHTYPPTWRARSAK